MSPKPKPKLFDKFDIKPNASLGLDVGTASCGWCWVENLDTVPNIIKAGVWMFKEPVTDKERSPKNEARRSARLARRTVRRRCVRRQKIRELLCKTGFLPSAESSPIIAQDPIGQHFLKPWELRLKGLDEKLSYPELCSVILHIGKRRGFKSNSKNDAGDNETSKMLGEMKDVQAQIGGKNTYAKVVDNHADRIFIPYSPDKNKEGDYEQKRYRNREGSYKFTPFRDDIIKELETLLNKQVEFYPDKITSAFIEELKEIITTQRPIQDPVHLLGNCTFEQNEKRCSMASPSFEEFRYLQKLVNLKIMNKATGEIVSLTPTQIKQCQALFLEKKKITYKDIEKTLDGFSLSALFTEEEKEEKMKTDITSAKGEAGKFTHHLKKIIPYLFETEIFPSKLLDDIAFTMTFYNGLDSIKKELATLPLSDDDRFILLEHAKSGAFKDFNKAGHLSTKAIRKIIPHLADGKKYHEACEAAGYSFRDGQALKIEDLRNPSVKKSVTETYKQVIALIEVMGYRPEKIFIEMTRELADTKKKKAEKHDWMKENEKFNFETMQQFKEYFPNRDCDYRSDEFLAFKLWKRQGGYCIYSGEYIDIKKVLTNDTQIDHILPFSRFFDDAQKNKVLVFTTENQRKKNRTPYEWFTQDNNRDWEGFKERIHQSKLSHSVKKTLLLEPETTGILKGKYKRENEMRSSALNATGHTTRFLKNFLVQELYDNEGHNRGDSIRIIARSGQMTSLLRHYWGVESLKKDKMGNRSDDQRHHAIDAIVVSLADAKILARLIYELQAKEEVKRRYKHFIRIKEPFEDFREKVQELYYKYIQVSRSEDRRVRGKLHDDTIHAVRIVTNKDGVRERKVVKRIPLEKLKEKDLENLTGNPERNQPLKEKLYEWLAGDKKQPLVINHIPIKKVSCYITDKPAFEVRGGTAGRGAMHRVDIFTKANAKGIKQYFMIPIYNYQVLDKKTYPTAPNQAIDGNIIDDTYEFQFSLYSYSYIKVIKKAGDIPIEGFYRSMNISNANIRLTYRNSADQKIFESSIKTIHKLEKWTMNRLGNLHEIKGEKRLW